jgi:hypothetical protein
MLLASSSGSSSPRARLAQFRAAVCASVVIIETSFLFIFRVALLSGQGSGLWVVRFVFRAVHSRKSMSVSFTRVTAEAVRLRLQAMDDDQLRRFGESAAFLCSPEANYGKPPREEFVLGYFCPSPQICAAAHIWGDGQK